MANLPEAATWAEGVYQIELTDPVVGGPDGISNMQAKQLANRTTYLKEHVETLESDVEALELGVGEEGMNALWAGALGAVSDIGVLVKELDAQRRTRHQEGVFTLVNRGVKSGCAVTKSATATRNLNIAAGVVFMAGRTFEVAAQTNAASVPSNSGAGAADCVVYLDADMELSCTGLGESAPADGLELATITVPAGNTDVTDPYLDSCTLTATARQEPFWPGVQTDPASTTVAFARRMEGAGYVVNLDVVSYEGGEPPTLRIADDERAVTGFGVYLGGLADTVVARWTAHLMG